MRISPLKIILLLLIIVGLGGCQWLDSLRDSIRGQIDQTYQNINEKVQEAGRQYENTKQSIERKIDDVQNAARQVREASTEVGEAIDAVRRVTNGTATIDAQAPGETSSVSPSPGVPSLNLN